MPKKNPNDIRKNIVKVRLSDTEKLILDYKAEECDLKPAVMLRELLYDTPLADTAALRERTFMLNRWNANLNMIAKWCNVHKSSARTQEVQTALQQLERLIKTEMAL